MPNKPLLWSEKYRQKVISPELLKTKVEELKINGKKVVTLNGSFDLMHAGHLQIIYEASFQGDCLIVALNSDASVQKYKSPSRPIIPLEFRLQMMAALEFVDYVTWFDETDPIRLLGEIKPDIHVNGAEYGQSCIEADIVVNGGGRLYLVDRIPGLATSDIIKKIKQEA